MAVLGKEELPHVNDPPVHVVARVRLLGYVHDVSFVEFLHLGRVPSTLVLVEGILRVSLLHIGKIAM